jgi:2-polyprenyl-3-methyl-5-hydroxy-6-metoxy-1,4-benzoquinol methylase
VVDNFLNALRYVLAGPAGTIDHIEPGQIYPAPSIREHIARYSFAARFCVGKVCLDIACGCAYGSQVLASAGAARVVGADIQHALLRRARRHFALPRVTLVCVDAAHMPFGSGTFDLVVSFETIEHLREPRTFLGHVARVLTSDGVFVCSTPNRLATSPHAKTPYNRWHLQEYTSEEFASLLSGCFTSVFMFGQGTKRYQDSHVGKVVHVLRQIGSKWTPFERLLAVAGMMRRRELGFAQIEDAVSTINMNAHARDEPSRLSEPASDEVRAHGPTALLAVARK